MVCIHIAAMFRDPEYFSNPCTFDPPRFYFTIPITVRSVPGRREVEVSTGQGEESEKKDGRPATPLCKNPASEASTLVCLSGFRKMELSGKIVRRPSDQADCDRGTHEVGVVAFPRTGTLAIIMEQVPRALTRRGKPDR